jgi:hypothetical protein
MVTSRYEELRSPVTQLMQQHKASGRIKIVVPKVQGGSVGQQMGSNRCS